MRLLISQASRLFSKEVKDIIYFMAYYVRTTPARIRDRFPGKRKLYLEGTENCHSYLSKMMIPKEIEQQTMECCGEGARFVESGKLELLGRRVEIGWPPTWENFNFSDSVSTKIQYYGKGVSSDIKLNWELERLQWLPVLSAFSKRESDTVLANEIFETILDFAEGRPYGRTSAWMEGIEVSLRAISVLISIGISPDFENFSKRGKIVYWLSIHGEWLNSHLSRKWRMNNNHLIIELIGLIIIGSRLANHPESRKWKSLGLDILIEELEKQTIEGRNWEPTTAYHRFVTEALLVLHSFIEGDESIGIEQKRIIHDFCSMHVETLLKISDDAGIIPLIGDDDAAVVLPRLGKIDSRDSSFTIGFARKLGFDFERGALGLMVWRGHGTGVIWDRDSHLHAVSGAIPGPGKNGSHRHVDMLSVTLRWGGSDILSDCGTGLYFGSKEWRDYFRLPMRHSGVFSRSIDWADVKGPFEITNRSTGDIYSPGEGRLTLSCTFDGVGGAIREVSLCDWGLEIIDSLEIPQPSINMVLPKDVELSIKGNELHMVGEALTITCVPPPVNFTETSEFQPPDLTPVPKEGYAVLSPGYGEYGGCKIAELVYSEGSRVITKIYRGKLGPGGE